MAEVNPTLDRRALLRSGALALSAGAFLAACGAGRSGSSAPGRVGVAPPLPTLPAAAEITDVTRLRTLQSLEHSMLDVYAGIAERGGLPGDTAALAETFVADHTRAAEALGELITAAGGQPYACANAFFEERQIGPALAAVDGSDDPARDLGSIAHAFEDWCARSYQAAVPELTDPALRSAVMAYGSEANRRCAGLAVTLSPDTLFSPALEGGQPEVDENDFPVIYAIPARFGQLTGIDLRVGAVTDDGARQVITLQTPADNSYIYDELSC